MYNYKINSDVEISGDLKIKSVSYMLLDTKINTNSDNLLSNSSAGFYVKPYTVHNVISSESGNIIVQLDDGLYVEKMKDIEINISKEAGNNISNNTDGLFIPKYIPTIDSASDNIVSFDDGYFANSYDSLTVKISAEEGNKITNDGGLYIEKQESSTVLLNPESNNEIKNNNGLYLKDAALKLSTKANNAIVEKENGLYLEEVTFKDDVKISSESDNSLIDNDGLYVKDTEQKLSTKENNNLVMKDDGIYLAGSNASVDISPNKNNRIFDSEGLFAYKNPDYSKIDISKTTNNRLKVVSDGLYVSPDQIDVSVKPTNIPITSYPKDMYGNGVMVSELALTSYPADSYKFAGASFHNDNIYFCPYNTRGIVKYNVKTHEEETFPVRDQEIRGYWHGSVKYKNKIFHVPWTGHTIGLIDTDANTLTEIGSFEGTGKWGCAVLSPMNRIYCIPHTAMQVLVIDNLDSETPSTKLVGTYPSANKWSSGLIDRDGNIYCIPFTATEMMKIIPGKTVDEDVYEMIPLPSDIQNIKYKFRSGTVAPNGKLYMIPYGATFALIYDPHTNTFTTLPVPGSEVYKFIGTTLGMNGLIYALPYDTTQIIEINPNTNEIKRVGPVFSANKSVSFGSIMDDDGNIYTVPSNVNSIFKISPPNSGVHSWAASPYINKL